MGGPRRPVSALSATTILEVGMHFPQHMDGDDKRGVVPGDRRVDAAVTG